MAPTIIYATEEQLKQLRPLTHCLDCDEIMEGHVDMCNSCGTNPDLVHGIGIFVDSETVIFVEGGE